MRSMLLVLVALSHLSMAAFAQSKLDELSWMVGSWRGTEGEKEMEEVWTAPKARTMLGLHRDVQGDRTTSYEFMRIQEEGEGTITFHGGPPGQAPTPFRMVEQGDGRAVFENPTHDFPQRVIYWLDDQGSLNARIEGAVNGKAESAEWTWQPADSR